MSVHEPDKYFGVPAWLSDQARYAERLRMVAPERIDFYTIKPTAGAEPPAAQ